MAEVCAGCDPFQALGLIGALRLNANAKQVKSRMPPLTRGAIVPKALSYG